MCDVIKRDGSRAKFDIHKIIRVMELAFKAENKTVFPDVLELMALRSKTIRYRSRTYRTALRPY